jgi:hypothetical protein
MPGSGPAAGGIGKAAGRDRPIPVTSLTQFIPIFTVILQLDLVPYLARRSSLPRRGILSHSVLHAEARNVAQRVLQNA